MRLLIVLFSLAAIATPASAEAPTPQLPPEITDGRMLDQLGNITGVLAKALLSLPVGEVEAAIDNRPVTPQDRKRTVATEMGADARNIDKDVERGKVAMKQGGQALVRALPVITRELGRMGEQLDRAVANMPSPTYPKR